MTVPESYHSACPLLNIEMTSDAPLQFLFCYSLLNVSLNLWSTYIRGAPLVNVNVSCKAVKSESSTFLHSATFVEFIFWAHLPVIGDNSTWLVYSMLQQYISKRFTKQHKSLLFPYAPGISVCLIYLVALHNLVQFKRNRWRGRPLPAAVIQENITGMTHRRRTCKNR